MELLSCKHDVILTNLCFCCTPKNPLKSLRSLEFIHILILAWVHLSGNAHVPAWQDPIGQTLEAAQLEEVDMDLRNDETWVAKRPSSLKEISSV